MRLIEIERPASEKLLRACALFGLALSCRGEKTEERRRERARGAAREVLERAGSVGKPAAVVFVTGPSGCGKSSTLRACIEELRALGRFVVDASEHAGRALRASSLVDALPGPLGNALASLACAGLAEPALFPRRARELSEGQRHRFALACAMHRAAHMEKPSGGGGRRRGSAPEKHSAAGWLVVDELGSTLDRVTAMGVATGLARWCRRRGVNLLAASAHHDVGAWLGPDITIVQELPDAGGEEEP